MIRLDIFITQQQKSILNALKKRDGVPVAEQVRRAIDIYIREKKNDYNKHDLESTKESS